MHVDRSFFFLFFAETISKRATRNTISSVKRERESEKKIPLSFMLMILDIKNEANNILVQVLMDCSKRSN
jgi:hypothetical protein